MDNKKSLVLIILAAVFISAAITSGCTGSSGKNTDLPVTAEATTSINTLSTPQDETPYNVATADATKALGEKLSEPVKLPGSITEDTAIMPEYDSETEEKLLNDAKSEILRVFPGANTSSLNNYHWGANLAGSFFVPVIIFEGVIADTNNPENVCEIVTYDPEKERIVHWYYTPDAPAIATSTGEIIRHEDVDIERDIIPVFKRMIGDEEYEENREKYFICLVDYINSPLTTCAIIYESYCGVRSDMGYAEIYFSRGTGEIIAYGEKYNNEKFLKDSVKLSPMPEISLDEAKGILEAKLDELYPDEPQEIEYCEYYDGDAAEGYTNGLFWLDRCIYLNIRDQYLLSPIPLGWRITFSTKESRNQGGPFDGARSAYIDANSGEILYLRNDRIDIVGKNYD